MITNADLVYPLHQAAKRGNLARLSALLTQLSAKLEDDAERISAIINTPDDANLTPLHHAVLAHAPSVIEKLLAFGADANAEGPSRHTPLHLASASAIECIQVLIENGGALVNATDASCQTPVHIAAANNNAVAISYLLDMGAKVNAQDAVLGMTTHSHSRELG